MRSAYVASAPATPPSARYASWVILRACLSRACHSCAAVNDNSGSDAGRPATSAPMSSPTCASTVTAARALAFADARGVLLVHFRTRERRLVAVQWLRSREHGRTREADPRRAVI